MTRWRRDMFKRNAAWLGIWTVLLLRGAAPNADAQAAAQSYTMTWVTTGERKAPRLQVTLPDGRTRQFDVDTGAPTSLLDRKVAMELHLPIAKITQNGSAREMEVVALPLKLGPDVLSLPNVQCMLADLSALQTSAPDLVGILGMDFLANYSLRLDYTRKQLTLIPGSVQGTPQAPAAAEKLPMNLSAGHYRLVGSLDGIKSDLILDTGADTTYVNTPEVLKQLHPRALMGSVEVRGFTEGLTTGKRTSRVMRLQELVFGQFKLKNPVVTRDGLDLPGIWLGNDYLQQFQIVFDFPAKTLYLTRDPAFRGTLAEWDSLVGSPTLIAPPAPTDAAHKKDPISVVTLRMLPGVALPLIEMAVNGGKPHLFIVDPGRPSSLIDESLVKTENLTLRTLKTESDTEVGGTLAERIEIQAPTALTVANLPFGFIDLSSTRAATQADIAGVLGANLLRLFVERIDFSKQQITFFARDRFTPPGKQANRLSLETEAGLYYLNTTLDDVPARFKIRFTTPDTLLQTMSLLSALKPIAHLKKLTVSDAPGSQRFRLRTMRVEGVTWDRPVLEYSPDLSEYDNVLGLDFFSRFYVTLDLGAKQVYLEPDPNFQEDLGKWLGTGFVSAMQPDGKMIVSEVLAPSPASEAGVRPDDEIIEINGLPLATTSVGKIVASAKHAEGAVVTLKVQRKGEEKPREFTMKMRKLL